MSCFNRPNLGFWAFWGQKQSHWVASTTYYIHSAVNEMYVTVQSTNSRMHVSSSQGVTDVNSSQKMSTQGNIRPETINVLFSQDLQMPQIQSQAEFVNKHNNLLKQGVTLPRTQHPGVRGQFHGTADHVYFPASKGVMVQGTEAAGPGDSHSTALSGQGSGTVSQDSADRVIPSLQALRNSAEINKKVTQRYQELEDMAQLEQGSLDLLLQSLSQRMRKSQKAKVKWPQDLAFVGTLRHRPMYDQLSITQWLLSFLRIRQEEQDPLIRENMIEYLTELAQDACDYSCEAAKGARLVLLRRMGDGVVHWSNIKDVQKIRTRYAQITSASSVPDKSKSLKMVPCIQFNQGTCNRNTEHEYKTMLLKHMYQFCFSQNNKIETHAKKDC